jgi:hypothetical protein
MHKPGSIEAGINFDLLALGAELRLDEQYARGGHMARTLVRAPDQRIVLMAMKAGARIVSLGLPTGSFEMKSGELLVLAGGLRHHVDAREESTLLLTLGWSDSA